MPKEKIQQEDSIEELERQQRIIADQLRQKKRTDSEINLQMAVGNREYPDNLKQVMQACYNFIATHRNLKGIPSPVTNSY